MHPYVDGSRLPNGKLRCPLGASSPFASFRSRLASLRRAAFKDIISSSSPVSEHENIIAKGLTGKTIALGNSSVSLQRADPT